MNGNDDERLSDDDLFAWLMSDAGFDHVSQCSHHLMGGVGSTAVEQPSTALAVTLLPDSTIVECCRAFAGLFKLEPIDLRGVRLLRILPLEARVHLRGQIDQLSIENPCVSIEHATARPTGLGEEASAMYLYGWVKGRYEGQFDAEGRLLFIRATLELASTYHGLRERRALMLQGLGLGGAADDSADVAEPVVAGRIGFARTPPNHRPT